MPDNTKERSHAKKISFYQSQQWLLTVQHINIPRIKEDVQGYMVKRVSDADGALQYAYLEQFCTEVEKK